VASVVPFAIAVDDGELLDDISVDMLRVVARMGDSRGVIAITVNREATAFASGPLAAWLDEEQRYAEMTPESARLTRVLLPDLTDEELVDVALQVLRFDSLDQGDASSLSKVVAASRGRPGRLAVLTTAPSIHDAVIGAGDLPTHLDELDLPDQLASAFFALSADVQSTLATLGLLGRVMPASWPTERPVGGSALLTASGLERPVASHWLTSSEDGQIAFAADLLWQTAYAARDRALGPSRQQAIVDAWQSRLRAAQGTDAWLDLPPATAESFLDALLRALGPVDLDPALLAELMRLRRVTGRDAADEETLRLVQERLAEGTTSRPLTIATAEALLDAIRDEAALELLQAQYDRAVARHGDGAGGTLPALEALAAGWAAVARRRQGDPGARPIFDHAIALYERLVACRVPLLSRTDPKIPLTRRAFAELLADDYRYKRAIEQATRCVAELASTPGYGSDHPDTLTTRGDLATWTGAAGDPATARDLSAALQLDRDRVLGPEHPDTLSTRNNLAFWTGEAGDPATARDQFAALLADQLQALGPDHLLTLTTRNDHATRTGEAGDPAAARDLLGTMLPDLQRILGPDHPDTLISRSNLANGTGRAGDPATARDLFAALLPDQERILGPDHPDNLITRSNLAGWTQRAAASAASNDGEVGGGHESLPDD
jgi:hypothetical protein